jgi:hypothetical protein
LGAGGGYNVADVGTQNVYAVGTSNVYQNGLLTSSGSAAGPANVETNSQSAVALSALRAVISSTFMAVIGCGEPNLPTAI